MIINSNIIKYRSYTTEISSGQTFLLKWKTIKEHSGKIAGLWLKISIFICIPALLLSGANALQLHFKHHKQLSHILKECENDSTPEYSYQNIRNKKFFWGNGDKTLFWNDHVNTTIDAKKSILKE
ncbi:hypothetical protein PCANB_002250 [Pneumocystis canis]|nr:hypothetical protein PCK1_002290 [Pneumocystis canis]KAG5438920.1 hypothetical protein PCANB_002250 [Pneumocystis canis]